MRGEQELAEKRTADFSFSRNQAALAAQHRQLLRLSSSAASKADISS
jgi:hypothetical protein